MGDVISIGIQPGVNPWLVLVKWKREGYEVIEHNYSPYLHEHFYLLRKVGGID